MMEKVLMRQLWKMPLPVVCLLALGMLPLLPARRGSAQAVTYTATDLGTLGGAHSTALGLDECGKVVGESNPGGSTSLHPYFWDGSQMTDLGTFGGLSGGASAVNGAGRVAGYAQAATSEQRPFVWTQAAGTSDLGAAGTGAAAYDINDSNQVVGQWEISPLQDRAFVWTQATGMKIVTAPWGTPIAAYGIDNAGRIVGTAQTSAGASHAFLSSGGVVTDLGTLGGTNSFAYDLNEAGVVVGHANTPSSNASRPFHAFRWTSAGGMQDLGTLGGARSIAYGVNASGQIVGYAEVSPGVNRAFLWADANANGAHDAGELKDLNTLAPTAGWTYEEARAVNDRGQIVVTAVNDSGQRRAFLLTPDNAGPSPCDPTPTPTPTPAPSPTPTPAPTPSPTNFALASKGGVATASSTTTQAELPGMDFSPAGVINGDRRGLNWEHGGGWRDATNNAFPDWVQVDFDGAKSISEVGVFSLQDGYANPAEPTEALTFAQYGVTDFDLLYWDGAQWSQVPGASVTGNNKVWRKLSFSPVTTTKLRVVVSNALAGRSRLVEFEAWGTPAQATPPPAGARINAALTSNGGVATASSTTTQQELPGMDFSPAGVINGDRRGLNWEHGGGWRDATNNAFPDWLEVSFAAPTAVDEVGVFSLQDNYSSPVEPTEATAFTKYGVTVFEIQFWNGSAWAAVPGGAVTNNGSVWRKITFPAVTTTKVRVVVGNALAGRSRLVEVEAWGVPVSARINHAAASNGGAATASSTTPDTEYPGLTFPVSSVVNGDRRGLNWEHGGGWRDGTANAYPDWVQVEFAGARKVDEINVFSLQDNYTSPAEPTESLAFTKYGVTSFEAQYWDGAQWVAVPGGTVTGNNLVWRKVTFPAVTTTKVRVVVHNGMGGRSRLVEVEAVGPAS
jgi:probable HAF family extracellular repeat protein